MGKRFLVGATVLATTIAVAAPVAASAGPGQTVKIPSTVTVGPFGYIGKVTASNPNCVPERKVVLKQKGYGTVGSTTTNDKGKWELDIDSIEYKGGLPYKLFAEVKPLSQGTAGTIYKCLGATSKVRTINGG
jgi:hypothetical protein